ncbi:hypothetical protein BHM03_00023254 [Ensete ventricosum]|nr:hypothetical protein BHM03_00023254 [Ensete ventricosum]
MEANGFRATIFFLALYLVALGSGCLKPNMISHGADQFGQDDPDQSKKLSTYFNTAYFSFSMGELIALTALVWVQTRSGMGVGFGVSAAAMAVGLVILICGAFFYRNKPPQGSIFTPIARVKIIVSVIPIFACTIIFNTVLAQLQTFSVQQGSAMNTRPAKSFQVPPASLQAIPYIMLILLVPLYETCFVPLARRLTGDDSGIAPLQRIGVGLFTVTFSMVAAAVIEKKRRDAYVDSGEQLSIIWIAPQFLIFGLSEMFTAVGLIEFFYKQSSAGMRSFLTAMTYCSYSFGFYLSSLLVSLVNRITSSSSRDGWLRDNDLNKDRLDLFYWLLAALSLVNFFSYLLCSRWYSSSRSLSANPPPSGLHGEDDHLSFTSSKHVAAEAIL